MFVKDKKSIGIVFGVFDGLHKGHEYFLNEAIKLCHELIIVLTQPEVVISLKGHKPRFSFNERARSLHVFNGKIKVLSGDKKIGEWTIFRDLNFNPKSSIIILGYDQKDIAEELKRINISFVTLLPFYPEKYKSSLL